MIKTLYKEKCLRYFIIPEIILLFILFFKFSILVYIILPLYVIESIFDNIFFNIPLIWLLFKITTMYFSSIKFKKINKIEEYKDYIGSLKETDAYKTIEDIRLDKNIYERIREFDDLISELDKAKDGLIEIEKTSLKEKVEKYKKEFFEKLKDNPEIIKKLEEKLNEFLEKEVNSKDNSNDMAIFMKSKKLENIVNNFEEEYKNSAKKEIEKLENYLNEVAEDKTDIHELRKSIKSTYNNYKDEIAKSDIKNISVTIAKAIKDKEDFNAEINGKAKKKERVKLRKISINSKSNIESEDEVNEYISAIEKDIEKLKNEMLEAIKNNKIVDIG